GEPLGSSTSGRVHASTNDDCEFGPDDILLSDVRIDLLDADGEIVATTLTDAEGRYRFDNLAPGEYQVFEHQPTDYFNGDARVGTSGGRLDGEDTIAGIILASGTNAFAYDFCEHVGVGFSGWVYYDPDNDGTFDESETGIGGVTLSLLDADGNETGVTTTTSTNAANLGYYEFTGLPQGTYGVAEVQPVGYLDGLDTVGDRGGIADSASDRITGLVLAWGQNGAGYNFGELLPGSISGAVYVSPDGDCLVDEHEQPIADVVIELYNAQDELIATTTTDSEGRYQFTDLEPGDYAVREQQPDGFFDGGEYVGSGTGVVLGEDHIGQLSVGSGEHLVDNNFCEIPPASISGYVFQDGDTITTPDGSVPENLVALRDGTRTPDDRPISGVTLELRNGVTAAAIPGSEALPGVYGDGPIRTVTGADGFYEFVALPPGTYAVYEIHPDGFSDGIDTPGSAGGLAVNRHDPVDSDIISQLTIDPNDDAILSIPLAAGTASVENNFSEVIVNRDRPPILPPVSDPPAPPAALFISPIHPLPPLPVPVPRVVPDPAAPVYGSNLALAFTWHLSVIDAGRPRSIDSNRPRMQLTGSSENIAWSGEAAHQTLWTLLQIDYRAGEAQRTALFGDSKGVPVTGDFNGDGQTDLGLFLDGEWYIDVNGNGRWDEGDLWAKLGEKGDTPVTGDWDGDGKTDIGIFGPSWSGDPRAIEHEAGLPDRHNRLTGSWKNVPPQERDAARGIRTMKLTSEGIVRTDLIDHVFRYGESGDTPVAGDWNGDGIDTIGVFRHGMWHLDTNGDGRLTADDRRVEFGRAGDVPMVGDWDGDGIDELGVYRDGSWLRDSEVNNHLFAAHDQVFHANGTGLPIVGDWDGDGREEPGMFHGGPQTVAPE
ncbi:MAG: SdrD B-like domain-containing protein, partial [Pirellulales bacterium]